MHPHKKLPRSAQTDAQNKRCKHTRNPDSELLHPDAAPYHMYLYFSLTSSPTHTPPYCGGYVTTTARATARAGGAVLHLNIPSKHDDKSTQTSLALSTSRGAPLALAPPPQYPSLSFSNLFFPVCTAVTVTLSVTASLSVADGLSSFHSCSHSTSLIRRREAFVRLFASAVLAYSIYSGLLQA